MGDLLSGAREHALKRPWLLIPLLLGVLGPNVLTLLSPGAPGSMALKVILTALLTVAVTALFTELWLGDGKSFDPGRFIEAGTLFILPYPLLLLFGGVTTPLVYWILRADVPQAVSLGAVYGVLAVGKLAAFAAGAVSALGAARRRESEGALGALMLGVRVLRANSGFFFLLLVSTWIFQEACVFLARSLAPGFIRFLTTTIPLLGCVALPIEAWSAGRLRKV